MPVNEMLSSANSRSAFLQSLQRSREREERREKELQNDRKSRGLEEYEKDRGTRGPIDTGSYAYSRENMNYKADTVNNNYDKSSYDKFTNNTSNFTTLSYDKSTQNNSTYDPLSYSSTNYDKSTQITSSYNSSNFDKSSVNGKDTVTSHQSTSNIINTPTMPRRRLSSSPSSVPSNTPLKPVSTAIPLSQSKLASHAFTMSRSSTEDENDRTDLTEKSYERAFERSNDSNYRLIDNYKFQTLSNDGDDFKKKYEDEYNQKPKDIAIVPVTDELRSLIDSVVESYTVSLKNDLQNLHIEMIKQSVAQQSAFRSLLETYLPLTGKLMDSLSETREENERLKLRIEELSRRR